MEREMSEMSTPTSIHSTKGGKHMMTILEDALDCGAHKLHDNMHLIIAYTTGTSSKHKKIHMTWII